MRIDGNIAMATPILFCMPFLLKFTFIFLFIFLFSRYYLDQICVSIYAGRNQGAEASHLDGCNCHCLIWGLLGV